MTHESEDTHIELAALADGTLQGERRELLLALVADSPELATELEHQQRALALVSALERVAVPDRLRRAIEQQVADLPVRAGDARVGARRGPRLGWPRLAAGVALAAAAAVVALVVALAGGGGSSPRTPLLLQASNVGLLPATQPGPATSSRDWRILKATAAGISYPDWARDLGWHTTGARADLVGGRTVTTVFYADRSRRRIGYSIVSGRALPVPAGSVAVVREGMTYHVVQPHSPTVVTWRAAGHTCILTARGVGSGTLVRLAAWQHAA